MEQNASIERGSTAAVVPVHFMCGETAPLRDGCIHTLFEQQVECSPEAIAVEIEGQQLTYRQLNQRANQVAHLLRQRGVGPDVLVGVCLARSLELVIAIYGVLKAGGAYVPLDPAYPQERLRYMVDSVQLKHLVTLHEIGRRFGQLSAECLRLDTDHLEIDRQASSNPISGVTGDNLIYLIFTSGSTGQPKAAAVYHRGFSNLLQWFVDEFAITERDRSLLVSSLSFDLTQKNLYATLVRGGTLHLYAPGPYDISKLERLIQQHQITLMNCTPSAFYPLIEPLTEQAANRLRSLRIVFLGGEPISIPRVKPWLNHPETDAEIANTYGPTECTDICGFYRLNSRNLAAFSFVPLGRPVTNVQMAILRPDMSLAAVGEAGELCVAGAGVGAGYVNDRDLTEEKFVAHAIEGVSRGRLYRTGDQARWHPEGVIEFLGRLDHQVKVRGFRIELPEIERAVELHEGVREAIVVVRERSDQQEPQLICCYTEANSAPVSAQELRCFLTERLPGHMIPSSFQVLEQLPLSPNGKVDRKALSQLIEPNSLAGPEPEVRGAMAELDTNQLESSVQELWCHLLGRGEVGQDDNFFDLGGDSLLLARLHQQLESMLRRRFPITDLFAHPTVRGMATHLAPQAATEDGNRHVRDRARKQREAMAARRRRRNA